MVASSRSRSEMFVVESVNTTANARHTAMIVSTYTTVSMILKLSVNWLEILAVLEMLRNTPCSARASATSICSASLPERCARQAFRTASRPKAARYALSVM